MNHKVPSETRSQRELTNSIICNRSKKPKLRAWKRGLRECWLKKCTYLEKQASYSESYTRKKKKIPSWESRFPFHIYHPPPKVLHVDINNCSKNQTLCNNACIPNKMKSQRAFLQISVPLVDPSHSPWPLERNHTQIKYTKISLNKQ